MLNPEEEGNFLTLYRYVHRFPDAVYKLVSSDGIITLASYDTDGESDNCLELDDSDYEEYIAIIFCNKATGKLFEINYHNLPASVWCDGEKVY